MVGFNAQPAPTGEAKITKQVGSMQPRTMAEKVWDQHVVVKGEGEGASREPDLIYIDLHLVHEVTSPQAFDGLRLAGRPVRRPDLTIATEDHNVPTDTLVQPKASTSPSHTAAASSAPRPNLAPSAFRLSRFHASNGPMVTSSSSGIESGTNTML